MSSLLVMFTEFAEPLSTGQSQSQYLSPACPLGAWADSLSRQAPARFAQVLGGQLTPRLLSMEVSVVP